MNKQRPSLDMIAQKMDDMLAFQNQWANAPSVDMFDAKQKCPSLKFTLKVNKS